MTQTPETPDPYTQRQSDCWGRRCRTAKDAGPVLSFCEDPLVTPKQSSAPSPPFFSPTKLIGASMSIPEDSGGSGENMAVLRGLSDLELQQRIVVLSSARDRTSGGLRDQIHDHLVQAAEVRDERRALYEATTDALLPTTFRYDVPE